MIYTHTPPTYTHTPPTYTHTPPTYTPTSNLHTSNLHTHLQPTHIPQPQRRRSLFYVRFYVLFAFILLLPGNYQQIPCPDLQVNILPKRKYRGGRLDRFYMEVEPNLLIPLLADFVFL